MFRIAKDFTFAAAHAIRGHQGGCERLHGHNYRVRIHVGSDQLDPLGMVMDFADLKALAEEILAPFDHQVINEIAPFDELNPTAEVFARYVFEEVAKRLPGNVVALQVDVWENDRSYATFAPG